jgi:hypothetical protein
MAIAASKAGHVRQFREDDIPQVADIHRRVFQLGGQTTPEMLDSYRAWFLQVFLSNPWRDESVRSLVYEDYPGRIKGFLGVMPQRMVYNEQRVRVAIMTNFVVDKDSRGVAGISLMRSLLSGPQDLAIADEATPDVRRMWDGLGGATSLPYSIHWYYPLRPCQFAAFAAKQKKFVPGFLVYLGSPVAQAMDAVITRFVKFPFRKSESRLSGRELDPETLARCLSEMTHKLSLRPDSDPSRITWIVQRARQLRSNGRLRPILLTAEKGDVAGWYLYYANPRGVSQVLQLHAKVPFMGDVLDHLLHDAWQQGVTVLSGRPERDLMPALSERHFIFSCGPAWALIHSKKPELINAFHRGDVFFSRLEGEWCSHFR